MTANIVHRSTEVGVRDVLDVWEVRCCTEYRVDAEVVGVAHGAEPHRIETGVIRSLVAHLADEHGVMVVRTLVVHDESPCPGPGGKRCAAELGLSCGRCDDTGVLTSERNVTVDQHTTQPQETPDA